TPGQSISGQPSKSFFYSGRRCRLPKGIITTGKCCQTFALGFVPPDEHGSLTNSSICVVFSVPSFRLLPPRGSPRHSACTPQRAFAPARDNVDGGAIHRPPDGPVRA